MVVVVVQEVRWVVRGKTNPWSAHTRVCDTQLLSNLRKQTSTQAKVYVPHRHSPILISKPSVASGQVAISAQAGDGDSEGEVG